MRVPIAVATVFALGLAVPLAAQEPAPSPSPAPAPAAETDATEFDPVEPDFTVVNLPTTLRLPRWKLAFSITHRFARPLGRGEFSDLLADFFGFDSGAQIGLGLRLGLADRTQVGIYRTSDRTITFFGQQELLRQDGAPVGLAAIASVEGLDNFQEEHSPRFGVVVSRRLGTRAALYVMPAWVGNTNIRFPEIEDDSTFVVGVGTRVRLSDRMYLVGELTPRVAGFETPIGGTHAAFGFEHRVGGHSFQINFSNDIGTTPAQVARGKQTEDDWFLGFNISRKFY
jgi:hypothetical protein